jgi:L-seryl-tRNA(Ser) seleniumtransferase
MSLRALPSVESLLQTETAAELARAFGRPLTLQALQESLEAARSRIRQGAAAPVPEEVLVEARAAVEGWLRPTLRPVINATGVILHTNLGRAPLSREASLAAVEAARGYTNLEFDLERGGRGSRAAHVEGLLQRLVGGEAALVVNNNAAAVLLALTALARRKQVVISRSQLVEIGGGFRVPDVMKESGAHLVEVGTTNRTHVQDFEAALTDRTALILRAHHSNFRIIGFTTEPSLAELVETGGRLGVPVFDDLGSGALLDTQAFGLGHEPTVQESLHAGAALVAFSGDKLLGGPQAGLLVGRQDLVDRLRRHPLARALRPDKTCLAALAVTLTHYLKDEALEKIPVWQMIAMPAERIRERAGAWAARLGQGEVVAARSTVGGGSLPEETLPTWALALAAPRPNALVARLRHGDPPVVARVEDDRVLIDPRTVLPDEEPALLATLEAALGSSQTPRGGPR